MNRTRQHMLATVGAINCFNDPAGDGGGGETPPEGTKTPETPDPNEGEGDAEKEGEESNDFDSLPDWAKKDIKSLRKSEARYRTANKELTDKLKDAKSQDDIDAAVSDHQSRVAELELELARTTHTAGFTDAQKALVHGTTPEEIEASASAVRTAFAESSDGHEFPPNPDADGGTRPGTGGGNLTPRERARAIRERTRRR